MIGFALWLPALLLVLFCLIYSLTARRALYFPLPKGLRAGLRNPRAVFLGMLCALIIAAAASMAEAVGGTGPIQAAGIALRVMLFCLFGIYILALPKPDRRAAVMLITVALAGVLIRVLWSAPVDIDALVLALGRLIGGGRA